MPDKEIAGLTAGATPDGTEIFHCVQGGNSRRFTGAQLVALAADPASDDGDGLGTAVKRWSDLFLASGGVVNWANGDVTLTHSANALAFAGASSGYVFDDQRLDLRLHASEIALHVRGSFPPRDTGRTCCLHVPPFERFVTDAI